MQDVSVYHRLTEVATHFDTLLQYGFSHATNRVRNYGCRDEEIGIQDNVVVSIINGTISILVKGSNDVKGLTLRRIGSCPPRISQ